MYVYKVSNAGVSEAFVIAVHIESCFDLTAFLCVVIADGMAVDSSVFLTTYQSVLFNSPSASFLTCLIKTVLRPSTLTSSLVPKPSSSSSCVYKVSACAFAVAVPYVAVTLPLPNA